MSSCSQLELLREGVTDADIDALRARLAVHGWQTRKQLVEALGWCERKVRMVAELMGADIVRGQQGFKLTETLSPEDLPSAIEAAMIRLAQSKKDANYGANLLGRLHKLFPQFANHGQ